MVGMLCAHLVFIGPRVPWHGWMNDITVAAAAPFYVSTPDSAWNHSEHPTQPTILSVSRATLAYPPPHPCLVTLPFPLRNRGGWSGPSRIITTILFQGSESLDPVPGTVGILGSCRKTIGELDRRLHRLPCLFCFADFRPAHPLTQAKEGRALRDCDTAWIPLLPVYSQGLQHRPQSLISNSN